MKTFIFIFIILLIIFIFLKLKLNLKVKWKTFFKKGFCPKRGTFGTFCFTGPQGKGKTYSLAEYVFDNYCNLVVYSNVHFNVEGINYFDGFNELLLIRDKLDNNEIELDGKQLVIVYDEIFNELVRGHKLSSDIINFLSQMRKRKIIFLTTCQDWSDLPIQFRHLCRYQIDCHMIPLIFTGILCKVFHDAENMKWSNEDQDFIAPIVSTTISKTRKLVSKFYDTMELIKIGANRLPTDLPRNIDTEFWNDININDIDTSSPGYVKEDGVEVSNDD